MCSLLACADISQAQAQYIILEKPGQFNFFKIMWIVKNNMDREDD